MGEKGREVGEKGEGSGGKGRGNWEWGTPLSTPSECALVSSIPFLTFFVLFYFPSFFFSFFLYALTCRASDKCIKGVSLKKDVNS